MGLKKSFLNNNNLGSPFKSLLMLKTINILSYRIHKRRGYCFWRFWQWKTLNKFSKKKEIWVLISTDKRYFAWCLFSIVCTFFALPSTTRASKSSFLSSTVIHAPNFAKKLAQAVQEKTSKYSCLYEKKTLFVKVNKEKVMWHGKIHFDTTVPLSWPYLDRIREIVYVLLSWPCLDHYRPIALSQILMNFAPEIVKTFLSKFCSLNH